MNPNSFHLLTIGTILIGLRNLGRIMDKAKVHADAHHIAIENLLQARLYPNMFNLLQQLQYVSYLAVEFARHFSDSPAPRVGYDEATWAELRQSLDMAAAYLTAVAPSQLSQQADKIIPIFMDSSKGMAASDYAASVIVPDFHFHMIMAYALLRHNGVPIGKSDFLGDLSTVDLPANKH